MAAPVPAPRIPVLAERGGTQLKTPKPVLLVDTREQNPLDCSRFAGWFAGIEKRALKLGDYSIAGLEDTCVVERKDLADLVHSLTTERSVFVSRLRRMAGYPHRLLVITAALSHRNLYPWSLGMASRNSCIVQIVVGWGVTLQCTILREPISITTKTYSNWNRAVTATRKSQATIARA
jgi:ERCC4-type nuclease